MISQYNVKAVNIVGHSDIAPGRKEDPGIYFPWKKLYEHGIGAWYDEADVAHCRKKIVALPPILDIRTHLKIYGYDVGLDNAHKDHQYYSAVVAFERHFTPETVDGNMRLKEYHILRALNKKYRRVD